MADLIERTSAGNAHTNYQGLRTFWKWMVLEEEARIWQDCAQTIEPGLPEIQPKLA